jgi:hypothetical protein
LVDFEDKGRRIICSVWVEEFHTKFARGYCAVEAKQFLSYPGPDIEKIKARGAPRGAEQTNKCSDADLSSFIRSVLIK